MIEGERRDVPVGDGDRRLVPVFVVPVLCHRVLGLAADRVGHRRLRDGHEPPQGIVPVLRLLPDRIDLVRLRPSPSNPVRTVALSCNIVRTILS